MSIVTYFWNSQSEYKHQSLLSPFLSNIRGETHEDERERENLLILTYSLNLKSRLLSLDTSVFHCILFDFQNKKRFLIPYFVYGIIYMIAYIVVLSYATPVLLITDETGFDIVPFLIVEVILAFLGFGENTQHI